MADNTPAISSNAKVPARLSRRLGWLPICASLFLLACQSTPPVSRAPIEDTGQSAESSTGVVQAPEPEGGELDSRQPLPTDERPEPARPASHEAALLAIEEDAEQFLQQQDWRKAIEVAERGLRIDRRYAEFYRILGVSYQQLGDTAQAQRFAQQARRFCRSQCRQVDELLQQLQF